MGLSSHQGRDGAIWGSPPSVPSASSLLASMPRKFPLCATCALREAREEALTSDSVSTAERPPTPEETRD